MENKQDFFCDNCSFYEINRKRGRCMWNGIRESPNGNPSNKMINECKWDRDDKQYWLNKEV